MKNINKTYDPKDIEDRIYKNWESNGNFHATIDERKTPFTIVMPPPNVTGKLHMGHALDNTLQDIIIRYKRMCGYNALWVPGTDHAAISTEVKVTNHLKEQGIDKNDLGREGFLEKAWEWKHEYGNTITTQLRKLGSSCDWDREAFTMDDNLSKAVEQVFINLYNKGYIYKGNRIINWCPKCKTSISEAEVEHKEMTGHFWHIKYPYASGDGYIEIATTRPETLLGDSAVAVHPSDERYKDVIGKKVILPLVNKEIPIIADEYVDMEFGTGAVKITPAHDPNDFEVGKRHNLEEINILNDDATINENGGKYQGLDRYEARKQIIKDLEDGGYLIKIVEHVHNVGCHDRCGEVIEPIIKEQWFVKMDELKKPAIEAISNGDLRFVPERFNKIYLHWLENIHDWCISRQLWWGHRIPAYYCKNCGKLVVASSMPTKCDDCGCEEFVQDEDTLDTWFSSALWPFSTLGWPDTNNPDYKYFYPTNVLVTGYDIIFFWVIRMVFSGYEHTGKSPFNTVFIHGLIRDEQGRKMSKSLGNGIDPLEIIEEYGSDALRASIVTGIAPGNDLRFSKDKILAARNFANKVWNSARFLFMNIESLDEIKDLSECKLEVEDKWILSSLNNVIEEVSHNIDKYELGIALDKIQAFIWDEYCDWYIEMAKIRFNSENVESSTSAKSVAMYVLKSFLKLLHPFMPFVTEEIYSNISDESLMMTSWPIVNKDYAFENDVKLVKDFQNIIKKIRNLRSDMNVEHSKKTNIYLVVKNDEYIEFYKDMSDRFINFFMANNIYVQQDDKSIPENCVNITSTNSVLYIPFEDLVDIEQEIKRNEEEKTRLISEINRAKGMLSNEGFISQAPQAKIDQEKQKLSDYENMLLDVEKRLEDLMKK